MLKSHLRAMIWPIGLFRGNSVKLFALGICLLFALLSPVAAFSGYSVQQDVATLPSGQTTLDVPLVSRVVSLDKAFVLLHYFYGQTPGVDGPVNADDGMVSAYLWDNAGISTIRFTRASSTVDITVSWSLVECSDNEFTVYRGSQAWSGTTALFTPAIGATVVGDNCLAWVNGTTSDNTGTTATREAHFTANVSTGSQTTLNLNRFQVVETPTGTLRWVVVEFDPAKIGGIDTGEQTITTQVESARASWAIAGCLKSQSLLLGQWRVNGDPGGNAHALALTMLDDVTGQAYVHTTDNFERTLRWYCIDFGAGVGNRFEGQIDLSADGAWTAADQSLNPVSDPTQGLSFVTMTSSVNDTGFPRAMARHWLNGPAVLKIERDHTGSASWIEWQVLELPADVFSQPVVGGDATYASPVGVERVGANSTTISATFHDPDGPVQGPYQVTFKLRYPDDVTELVLASLAEDGQAGVTIADIGGGNYTAAISWDPGDLQDLGFYDLYFQVLENGSGTTDGFENNLDELQVYDAVSNNPPTLAPGNTFCLPATVNRIGSDYTMLKAFFADADIPGAGTFRVTFKVSGPTAVETMVVNDALHGEQGLRITHAGGSNYEASVLWTPADTEEIGLYDLYFEVSDEFGATATDDYPSNLDELTLTSSPLTGDGYLLNRTHDSDTCGGPNSACHNIADHQGQSCLTCHTAHNTANIYLVKEIIQTPNSGARNVVVKTLGAGDPYNDPDPVPGDPTSGTLADDSDGVYTGVCEVCHTSTNHHRNDATTPVVGHHNAENCTDCHAHDSGFGGGESSGGSNCSCHSQILNGMTAGQPGFHHSAGNNADYLSTSESCLTCHVDHDIFRPDLNPGFGSRGSNLRTDATVVPVQGDATVLANTDFSATGSGGVCISCHSGNDCLVCHAFKAGEKANYNHMWVNQAQYGASLSAHNYTVPSTYSTDGSVFQANCVKCHNDNMGKDYQNSTETFGLHVSDYQEILAPLSIASPTSPLEEDFCFQCHSTTSNPNSGSNLDYYAQKAMSGGGPMIIESEFTKTSTHPVGDFNGIHSTGEDPVNMTRHVECMDCHNPHAATADRPPSPALSGALYGVYGVDVNGNRIENVTNSYQVCFKCHGDQHGANPAVDRFWVNMNTRDEFKPTSQSFHPVTAPGTNSNSPSLIPPWTESSTMLCEDCHASNAGGARGPHGSDFDPILKLRYDRVDPNPENTADYALCYSCHNRSSIMNDQSFGEHRKHIQGEDTACYVCHDAHGVAAAGVGDGTHLINFATGVVTPSSSGRVEFIDNGNNRGACYLTCHGMDHDPETY
jgi:hypothetical protein